MLEEAGLESAIDTYLPTFEKRTGIAIHYEKTGCGGAWTGRSPSTCIACCRKR